MLSEYTVKKKKARHPCEDDLNAPKRLKRRSGDIKDNSVFNPDCIFCGSSERKNVKIKNSWVKEKLSMFECDGWQCVFLQAEAKGDEKLMTRIRGFDLVACKTMFHQSCKKSYMLKQESWMHEKTILRKHFH